MKHLLVCISHHDSPGRLQYLERVLDELEKYRVSYEVVIDTNLVGIGTAPRVADNITTVAHPNLEHPFLLCWLHRQHMKAAIENFEWFLYLENDLLLSFENFKHYQENFEMLWPNFVPSFLRTETIDGEEFALDVTRRQPRVPIVVQDRVFCTLSEPYHALWCLPQSTLKETMRGDFTRMSTSREIAASYPMWELNKTPLVELDGTQISRSCFVPHLSNSYAPCPTSAFGKIKVADIFL